MCTNAIQRMLVGAMVLLGIIAAVASINLVQVPGSSSSPSFRQPEPS